MSALVGRITVVLGTLLVAGCQARGLEVSSPAHDLGGTSVDLASSVVDAAAVEPPADLLTKATFRVSLTGSGRGRIVSSDGRIDCPGRCDIDVDRGSTLSLDAIPESDSSTFVAWTGACQGSTSHCDVLVVDDSGTMAELALRQHRLTLSGTVSENVGVHTRSTPGGIDCADDCVGTMSVSHGQTVVLSVDGGACSLVAWSGACAGTGRTCELVVMGDVDVGVTVTRHNCVFVTSAKFTGSVGIAGAESACQQAAQAAGLPGTYRAWISSPTDAARDRFAGRGWVRPDGKPFADELRETTSNRLFPRIFYPPRVTERNTIVPQGEFAWTGTASDGINVHGSCSGWTSSSAAVTGLTGDPNATDDGWTAYGSTQFGPCDRTARVYCFAIDHARPLVVPSVAGPRAFVSDTTWAPQGGIDAADAICKAEADARLGGGTFLAYLWSAKYGSGPSRFPLQPGSRPWVRLDGIPLTKSTSDLFTQGAGLEAPLNVTSSGAHYGLTVWTGAIGYTCGEWSGPATGVGGVGESYRTSWKYLVADGSVFCSYALPIYCLER